MDVGQGCGGELTNRSLLIVVCFMFSPTLHIRPTNIRGHSVRYLCRHASENASRKRQIRIKGKTKNCDVCVRSDIIIMAEMAVV